MDLTTAILAHPRVIAVDVDLNSRAELASVFIKAFDDKGNEFPIDFDDAWRFLGYSTKANGLRKLKGGGFREGLDYRGTKGGVIQTDEGSYEGFAPDKYYMTINAFELFAMIAMTETGNKVRQFFRAMRDAYVELTHMLQSGTDREQAYILTYEKKNCTYVAAIQQQPRLCKFGFTTNIKERYSAHRRTFTTPYFFELRHVVEADDPKKAEEIFKNFPDIKDNVQQLKIGGSIQRETSLMPDTMTEERLYFLMRKACRQSASQDIVMSDSHDYLEIEREKTQQMQLQVQLQRDVELEKYRMDHEYRMEVFKRKRCEEDDEGGDTPDHGGKAQKGVTPRAGPKDDDSRKEQTTDEAALDEEEEAVASHDDEPEEPPRGSNVEAGGEEEREAVVDNTPDATQFERNVHEHIRSLCEFGVDERSMRTVDRFRTDRIPLFEAFVERYGKTTRRKFYTAVIRLEGVTSTVYSTGGRHGIEGFSGIRLKDRPSSDADEDLILQFIQEDCELGDDDLLVSKADLFEALQAFGAARGWQKFHRGHGSTMSKVLTAKGVREVDVRWRGVNSRVFAGIRPKRGYPTPQEVFRQFLGARTQKREGSLVKRAVLLNRFSKYAKECCKELVTPLTSLKMTQEMGVFGFKLVTAGRDMCFEVAEKVVMRGAYDSITPKVLFTSPANEL
ncbi:hypothetical protein KFL_010840020 [Klebsormidium nitens]|uniref:Uncharacterized protein n=1 Tax=Klebsormidium nitens TaxID=105231 RepID=A0A1Y1IP52_KLENI|nr:hypothetical protein KFL_010840020 [Klebsormidium nitens]|eukprot:GAQ92650.1 hypothetical protein KFL_010840020 [Klebsormidium nitens]